MTANHQAIFTQLRDHLDAEITTHRALVGLAERKQHDLVAGDMGGFSQVLSDEQTVLGKVTQLRLVRDRLLRAVATVLNLKLSEIKLSSILERVPEPFKAELARRRAELATLLERLAQITERNQALIRQGLAFTRELLGAIVGPIEGPAYDRRGGVGNTPSGRGSLVNIAG